MTSSRYPLIFGGEKGYKKRRRRFSGNSPIPIYTAKGKRWIGPTNFKPLIITNSSSSCLSEDDGFKDFFFGTEPVVVTGVGTGLQSGGMSETAATKRATFMLASKKDEKRKLSSDSLISTASAIDGSSTTTTATSTTEDDATSLKGIKVNELVATPGFFGRLGDKVDPKPAIQRLSFKLKTLLAPREQQHFHHFHKLFKHDLPSDDGLIMSFSSIHHSHPQEVLSRGRLYVTLTFVAFNCSLLGSERRFIVNLKNVKSVELNSSQKVPGTIKIETITGDSHHFGGLKNRDHVYSLIFRVWRMSLHPADSRRNIAESTTSGRSSLSSTTNLEEALQNPASSGIESMPSGTDADTTSSSDAASTCLINYPIECGCTQHVGKQLIDETLNLTPVEIFELFFIENPWMTSFEQSCKRSEKTLTQWSSEGNGQRTRLCSYTMELDNTFGPKFTMVKERQVYTPIGSIQEGFQVSKIASNEGVPYADNFYIEITYCITALSPTSSRVRVHAGVGYHKYLMGILKAVIERSAMAGMEAYYTALFRQLADDTENLPTIMGAIPRQRVSKNHPLAGLSKYTVLEESATLEIEGEIVNGDMPQTGEPVEEEEIQFVVGSVQATSPVGRTTNGSGQSMTSDQGERIISLLQIIAVLLTMIVTFQIMNLIFSSASTPVNCPGAIGILSSQDPSDVLQPQQPLPSTEL